MVPVRASRILWTERKSNDKKPTDNWVIVGFFGHVMRIGDMEQVVTTGMMNGKCSRGRLGEKMTGEIAKRLHMCTYGRNYKSHRGIGGIEEQYRRYCRAQHLVMIMMMMMMIMCKKKHYLVFGRY